MKILRGAPKFLDSRKGGSEKNVGLGGVGWGGGGSENLYTSKSTGPGGGAPKILGR